MLQRHFFGRNHTGESGRSVRNQFHSQASALAEDRGRSESGYIWGRSEKSNGLSGETAYPDLRFRNGHAWHAGGDDHGTHTGIYGCRF